MKKYYIFYDKTSKISIIMDEFKTPLHIKISNIHDSTIFKEQLNELIK
jgi:hypothetical protein